MSEIFDKEIEPLRETVNPIIDYLNPTPIQEPQP